MRSAWTAPSARGTQDLGEGGGDGTGMGLVESPALGRSQRVIGPKSSSISSKNRTSVARL